MISVLVVDDTPVERTVVARVLDSDPGITVIGKLQDGREAVAYLARNQPDVVVMDVNMPRLSGLDATREIMETCALPIILLTEPGNVSKLRGQAQEVGAVAVLPKPTDEHRHDHVALATGLIQTVKLMAEVRVVTRRSHRPHHDAQHPAAGISTSRHEPLIKPAVLAIGASTGGPIALNQLLSALPKTLPVPILIVQHISAGFINSLVQWLQTSTAFPIHVAADGDLALAGHIYFAPDGAHMGFRRRGMLAIVHDPPEDGLRPSANFLLRSAAETYGAAAIGVVLTGMGRDGAEGLKAIRDGGGLTLAQDEASSVVFGMPNAAAQIGAACYVLSPEQIAQHIARLFPAPHD